MVHLSNLAISLIVLALALLTIAVLASIVYCRCQGSSGLARCSVSLSQWLTINTSVIREKHSTVLKNCVFSANQLAASRLFSRALIGCVG